MCFCFYLVCALSWDWIGLNGNLWDVLLGWATIWFVSTMNLHFWKSRTSPQIPDGETHGVLPGILPGQSQERRPRSSMMRVFEQQMFFFWMFLSFREVGPTCTFQECWKVGRTEIVKLVKVHCISSLDFEGLEVFKSLATGINFVWTLQGVPNAWCSHSPVDLIDSPRRDVYTPERRAGT